MKSSPAKLAYNAAYRATHREEAAVYKAAYDASHRDAHREEKAAYYIAHREERLAYNNAYNSAHRDEIRVYGAAYHQAHTADRRAFLDKAKAGVGCIDCGATELLHFHHRDKTTKKHNIADMLMKQWCEIMDEVFKCDVLCPSCHTKRHNQEDKLLVV